MGHLQRHGLGDAFDGQVTGDVDGVAVGAPQTVTLNLGGAEVKVWTGSASIAAEPKAYVGGGWVPVTIKVWNGGAWV